MTRKTNFKIYASWKHKLAVFLVLLLPLIYFQLFVTSANITAAGFYKDVAVSIYRLAIAYGLAAVLGWIFAVSFYGGERARVALPFFDVLQSFPTFAALPVAVYFFGANNFTAIFFLVLAIIWPIFFSIISSLKLMRHDWQEAAQLFGLRGFNYLRYFLLPVSLPGLITGSIVGLGDGWEALIATEIIINLKSGLGIFFQSYSQNLPITIFGIIGFLLLIWTINRLVWLAMLDWSHKMMES